MQSRCSHEHDHLKNASRSQPFRSHNRTTSSPSSSSSHTHSRTQSASHHEHIHQSQHPTNSFELLIKPTNYLDGAEGGWLTSSPILSATSPTTPHQNTHRSLSTTANITEKGSAKERLGAISNDDILKLTQLTNTLPVVSRKHNHIQKEQRHTRHQPQVDKEKECINQQPQLTRHVPTGSHIGDTVLADLLNQDFMKSSSPASNTDDTSGLLIIPSCNPSTITTDTDDSQLSWENNNKQSNLDILTITNSHDTTRSAPPIEHLQQLDHPLTISTTISEFYSDTGLTPSSTQTSGNSINRRSWYKTLMNRDKKGKSKYDGPPTTINYQHSDVGTSSADAYHTLQPVPTIIDTDYSYGPDNLKSYTHPMIDTAANSLIPPQRSDPIWKKKKKNGNRTPLGRLQFRHKRQQSSTDIENGTATFHNTTSTTKRGDSRLRLPLISNKRRHSFDNLHEYDTQPATDSPSDMTATPSSITTPSLSSSAKSSSNIATAPTLVINTNLPLHHNTSALVLSDLDHFITSAGSGVMNKEGTPRKDSTNNDLIDGSHDTPLDLPPQDLPKKVFYFDYQSLPWDNKQGEPKGVKGLVKMMVDCGFGTISEKRIKPDEDDDGDDDGQDSLNSIGDNKEEQDDQGADDSDKNDQEDIPTIESFKVITGDAYTVWMDGKEQTKTHPKTGTRQIAEIHVDAKNDVGFIKLTQLANGSSLIKGHLVNLNVSFLVPDKVKDDRLSYIQENSALCKIVNDRLVSLEPFMHDAQAFMKDRGQQCRAFIPIDESTSDIQQLLLQHDQQQKQQQQSYCDSTDSSRSSSFSSTLSQTPDSQTTSTLKPPPLALNRTGSSSLWNCVPYQSYNAYEYRQDQLKDAVSDLQRGIDELRRSLEDTEATVHGVQIDMNDTKAKMDTYLKDVPETHYSELKRLEVSIESILANRAKSRGMELLYWLLTALLTGCAFLLWAVICALKLCQATISFPRKMIKAFNEHMEERNKVVKQAGRRIVAKGAERPPSLTSNLPEQQVSSSSTAQRPTSNRRRSSRRSSLTT
ncbi:hypothetical protein BC941DRAFT_469394 [Chlamydoabsidia padenii]|nr:hypothetical protein BC941DRAFT_469394 [Chlamydoabsidia padenii]